MTMKKFFGMLTALVMTSMAFTSCYHDDDIDTSMVLSGDWYGNFGMYYEWQDRHGEIFVYDSYDTDISFYPDYDYATHGYGYQVDYYKHGPYKKIYHSFDWKVINERIYLYYHHDTEYNTVIRDYRMTRYYFTGYFSNGSEPFELEKYGEYYDWNPYWHDYPDGWGYYTFDGWYGQTRAAGEATDSISNENEGTIIRFGNRFEK